MSLVVEYSGKLYTCLSLDDIIAEHKQWPKFNRDMSIFDYCLETIFLSFHLKFAAVVGFFHSLSLVTMLLLCVCMFFIRRRCCFFLQAFVVFTISLIEWLLCVHWIIWFRVVGCLAFRMQPRLYFHLLHWEHRKNCQTIHYTFFPFDIRSLCSPCSMLTHSYCCYSSVFMDAVSWVDAKYIHLHTKVYGFVTAYEERMCYWSCPLNRKFNGNEVFVCWAHTINSARTLRIQNIQANRKRKKIGRYGASNGERAFLRLFFSMCWVRLYHNSGNNIRPSAHTVPAIERKHSAIQRVRMLSLRSMDDTTDFPQNTHTFTPVIRAHTHVRMSCTPIL